MAKVIDLFANIDSAPLLLKRPVIQYTFNSYRIPLWVVYAPQIDDWPADPYYHVSSDMLIEAILINGTRHSRIGDNQIPETGQSEFSIHYEDNAALVCIGVDENSLWMYERAEIVAASAETYSLYGTKEKNGEANPPIIAEAPRIQKTADALRYSRFAFEDVTLNLIFNNHSIFMYGGWLNLSLRYEENKNTYNKSLGKYIVETVRHSKYGTTVRGIDFRHSLNVQFPIETFAKTEYPFIEEEYLDRIKPEHIGLGNGVPGICLQGDQIYSDLSSMTRLQRYDFRFPPGFDKHHDNFKIEIEAAGNIINDVAIDNWIEIFPGLGNPQITSGNGEYQTTNPLLNESHINSETGIVSVATPQALANGQWGNKPNKIRMYAVWPNSSMEDAVKFLLDRSGDETLSNGFFMEQSERMAPMGLYLDDSKSAFEWIEILQSGNIIGGQLTLINGMFQVRAEDPNRNKKFDIDSVEVLNHENMPVETAAEFWFSGWELRYKKSWAGSQEGKIIGNTGRFPTAEIYTGTDLTAEYIRLDPLTQYFNTAGGQARINILNDIIRNLRHKITELVVPFEKRYLELEIFDVIGYTPEALEENNDLPEWTVYSKKINIADETISLSLIERRRTSFWFHDPWIARFELNPPVPIQTDGMWPRQIYMEYPARFLESLPEVPRFNGFNHAGWNTRANGLGRWFDEQTPVNGSLTLYAVWQAADIRIVKLISETGLNQIVVRGRTDEKIILMNKMQGE